MRLTQSHLDRLVCPVCHGPLVLESSPAPAFIDCTHCTRRYPIVDNLPVLIASRAILTQKS